MKQLLERLEALFEGRKTTAVLAALIVAAILSAAGERVSGGTRDEMVTRVSRVIANSRQGKTEDVGIAMSVVADAIAAVAELLTKVPNKAKMMRQLRRGSRA